MPLALLVVPNFHHQWPLLDHPEFIRKIKEEQKTGAELLLHGLTHIQDDSAFIPDDLIGKLKQRFLTSGEGEFQGLPYYSSLQALREGKDVFERAFDESPRGFVAPAWLFHERTKDALKTLQFSFHEDHNFLYHIEKEKKYLVPAVTFTGRSAARAKASVFWAHLMRALRFAPIDVRVALHPVDFQHENLVKSIFELLADMASYRDFVSYEEFLSEPS